MLPDVPWPPTDGTRLKAYNLLRGICEYHECHLMAFGDQAAQDRAARLSDRLGTLASVTVFPMPTGLDAHFSRLRAILQLLPPSMGPFQSAQLAEAVRKKIEAEDFDIVFYDIINLAPYLAVAPEVPSIHSPNDATSRAYSRLASETTNPAKRLYLRLSEQLLKRYEAANYRKFRAVHVVSEEDARYLRKLDSRINVRVIPISVDDELLDYDVTPDGSQVPLSLLFTGALTNPGILSGLLGFIDEGLPVVLRQFPDLEFTILGKGVPDELRQRADRLPALKLVEWAPDYAACLASAHVIVAPDQSGTGLKNRVLQAMALGRPVVGSPIALEGFEFVDGEHALERTTYAEMGEAVIQLLGDVQLRTKVGLAARKLAAEKYATSVVTKQWAALMNEVATTAEQ